VLAQALFTLKKAMSPAQLEKAVAKLRVYTISDQDDTGPWIRKNFPTLFYIVSPGYEENGGGQYHYATWPGISGDKFHGRFIGADSAIVMNNCLDVNVRQNHGPLGEKYPRIIFMMEGDTPSFLGLINNGLNDPEHPDYGGWGGRYELYIPPFRKYMYEPETRAIWTDTQDEVYSTFTKSFHTSNHATIWRWRTAFQHDFFARMDWCVAKTYAEANHPPVAKLNHASEITVTSGSPVTLSATATDPDGNVLTYHWIYYKEAGSLPASDFTIRDDSSNEIKFVAPNATKAGTLHFILEVTDNGTPSLTRYQRVIVKVLPK
jgi:hypothetical protein